MIYKYLNPELPLGRIDKAYLRQVANVKRLQKDKIEEFIYVNNLLFEDQEKDNAKTLAINQYESNLVNRLLLKGEEVTIKIKSFFGKFDSDNEAVTQILNSIKKLIGQSGKKVDIVINNKHYAFNQNTENKLFDLLTSQLIENIEGEGSDVELLQELANATEIIIVEFKPTNKYSKNNSAFFKYNHVTHFDLTKYQIYNHSDDKNYDNCLFYALCQGGLNEEKQNILKLMIKSTNVPTNQLEKICDALQIQIRLKKKVSIKKDSRIEVYGKKYEEIYNIGNLDEHAFIINKTNITRYALEHYDEIKHLPKCNLIYNKRNEKDVERCIDSFDVVRILLENKEKLLTGLVKTELMGTQLYNKVTNVITNLKYKPIEGENYKPIEPKEPTIRQITNIFYDFETYKVTKTQTLEDGSIKEIIEHVPYLCCYVGDDNVVWNFNGEDCGELMLEHITRKNAKLSKKVTINLIAHNGGKYDCNFLIKYFKNIKPIEKGSKYMSLKGKYNEYNFNCKDSLLLISSPLSKFPKMFKIKDTIKEVISYNMYDKTDCIKRNFIPIEEGLEWIRKDGLDEKQFLDNIQKWNLRIGYNNSYSCLAYACEYCKIDCKILKQGYETFREWMHELANIDIDDTLTIASLAHKFFINKDCYEDVNEISGVPQQFIQKCVVGGRTMCNNNQKYINNDLTKKILDFDAVSLYPSAMSRMEGFLTGLPKILTDLNYQNIKHCDGLFLEVIITKVGKFRKFPLLSYINEETGVRNFTNDMAGRTIFIDKIALEDAIKFQEIEFEIIRGYCFNEGFNNNINDVIQEIFEERKKLKANDNPAEIVYKLIMNSGYGKSIMKEIETETVFFNNEEEMKVYISRNFNWVIEYEPIKDSSLWRVKVINPINTHFNIAHVGVSILSMSKRIMNEVMCLAEDLELQMYYQDTDSIHLNQGDELILSKAFYKKYKKVLIGDNMGQFHSDFELVDYKEKNKDGFDENIFCKNIYAKRSIFLGKKCYIDELVGTKEDGTEKIDYHIRLKGIPNRVIKYTAKQMEITVFELYEKLYEGDTITFDLTEGGLNLMNLKIHKNGQVETLRSFERKIFFK